VCIRTTSCHGIVLSLYCVKDMVEMDIGLMSEVKFCYFRAAVCVFCTFCDVKFVFVSVHLEAHSENLRTRLRYLEVIASFLASEKETEARFLAGDLNSRVNQSSIWVDRRIALNDIDSILLRDQLQILLGRVKPVWFAGWREAARITFRPTYKIEPVTQEYNHGIGNRVPSYTDRILYHTSGLHEVSTRNYSSHEYSSGSDHYPVFACFDINVI